MKTRRPKCATQPSILNHFTRRQRPPACLSLPKNHLQKLEPNIWKLLQRTPEIPKFLLPFQNGMKQTEQKKRSSWQLNLFFIFCVFVFSFNHILFSSISLFFILLGVFMTVVVGSPVTITFASFQTRTPPQVHWTQTSLRQTKTFQCKH